MDVCGGVLTSPSISHDLEMHLTTAGTSSSGASTTAARGPAVRATARREQVQSRCGSSLDHPFWLNPGESPYQSVARADTPVVRHRHGGATPRTGVCTDTNQC
jgi:hypothetical protein